MLDSIPKKSERAMKIVLVAVGISLSSNSALSAALGAAMDSNMPPFAGVFSINISNGCSHSQQMAPRYNQLSDYAKTVNVAVHKAVRSLLGRYADPSEPLMGAGITSR